MNEETSTPPRPRLGNRGGAERERNPGDPKRAAHVFVGKERRLPPDPPLGDPTPFAGVRPHTLTHGVVVLTVFPSPPRGEIGEGTWSRSVTPHPLPDDAFRDSVVQDGQIEPAEACQVLPDGHPHARAPRAACGEPPPASRARPELGHGRLLASPVQGVRRGQCTCSPGGGRIRAPRTCGFARTSAHRGALQARQQGGSH